ncbi:MAG: thioredoxin family protein [Trueperaceae bacterium]
MIIKILGPGCANCKRLETNVRQALDRSSLEATVVKVEDYGDMLAFGVQSTPALVVDERVRIAGRVPSVGQIQELLDAP